MGGSDPTSFFYGTTQRGPLWRRAYTNARHIVNANMHGTSVFRGVFMKVSDQLRKAIQDSGLSAAQLSKSTTMNPSTITRFLKGDTMPSLDNVDELCEVLHLELRVSVKPKSK